MLKAARHAVACEISDAGQITDAGELEVFVAQQFGVWDVLLAGKQKVAP